MTYYILSVPGEYNIPQIWRIGDGFANRVDVSGDVSSYKAVPGETICETLRRLNPFWFEPERLFRETELGPGEFYPRMWRPPVPTFNHGSFPEWNPSAQQETGIAKIIAIAQSQLTTLTRQLGGICQTVQPEEKNLDAFGHDIRNLLILACTEAEAHWRNVLVANGITQKQKCYKTGDYVKLLDPMKLDQYAVMFPNYPWLPAFNPFEGWDTTAATRSLVWYDAYNAVKHDRETQFERASLRRVFEAISACVIMMAAQFGSAEGLGQGSELRSFFHLSCIPDWPLSAYYIPPFGGQPKPVHYFKTANA
ncbi:MAG TPA: hypothetical protein VME69_07515 [Methylocella sp.]|nr:hypothetical protein [Methylocella sp.]